VRGVREQRERARQDAGTELDRREREHEHERRRERPPRVGTDVDVHGPTVAFAAPDSGVVGSDSWQA
jgi:hypothetical protein